MIVSTRVFIYFLLTPVSNGAGAWCFSSSAEQSVRIKDVSSSLLGFIVRSAPNHHSFF